MARVSKENRAICVRCGSIRANFETICPSCGHRPDDEGRLVAWLLSSENLSETELEDVRHRIAGGERIRPSARMLAKAKIALGRDFSSDQGLSTSQRVLLLGTSLLVTPLVGWVLFIWWYRDRPRAAIQALALSLPASVLFTILVLSLRGR